MSDNKNTGKFLLGVISGAALGSLLALLYAPDTGTNIRDRLSYRLNHYLEELSDLIDRLNQEKLIISDAKKQGNLVVEDAQQKAESLINEAEELLEAINEAKNSSPDSQS